MKRLIPTSTENGRSHFGELWDDAEEKNRTLIAACKAAEYVQLHFK